MRGTDESDPNKMSESPPAGRKKYSAWNYDAAPEDDSNSSNNDQDFELIELERRLNEEVDEDFFAEPKKFQTIHRVIDVLGLQMIDDATVQSSHHDLSKNPAYRNLKDQQQIVEGAIEHMAVIHCADLNGSVIQVGRVARQFSDAVSKVRQLRQQVRAIQDSLGASATANPNEPTAAAGTTTGNSSSNNNASAAVAARPQNAAAMSLRELWLKKLECEATLSLLDKLDIIRAAPARFDQLVSQPPCRIGAAVLTLSTALQTMFSDDVAQVQALHKIMEQLLLRKQRAEEMVWDVLHDVIYLRTGNGFHIKTVGGGKKNSKSKKGSVDGISKTGGGAAGLSLSSDSRRGSTATGGLLGGTSGTGTGGGAGGMAGAPLGAAVTAHGSGGVMYNPFAGHWTSFVTLASHDGAGGGANHQDDPSIHSGESDIASIFSHQEYDDDEDELEENNKEAAGDNIPVAVTTTSSLLRHSNSRRMMIPLPMVEAELDLEADERRCLEELALSGLSGMNNNNNNNNKTSSLRQRQVPRYADPVLALRIIVECLAQMKRLDDVERVLAEGLQREIKRTVQQEQARTFLRLEQKRVPQSIRSLGKSENLQDFRRHLTSLLLGFGNIMIRLLHLAEILRVRISSDKALLQTIASPSSVMRSVISSANDLMQREVREFLQACLHETEEPRNEALDNSVRHGSTAYETGLFSLGIVATTESSIKSAGGTSQPAMSTATRSNVMEMSVSKFVSTILFAKTKSEPQVRHALTFRRSVARWTSELEAAKKELATLTGEDTSAPSYNSSLEESAISYLDKVIQNDLLPVLQEEAVNGTVQGLERRDAFDPVLGRSLYARPNTNEPQDVDICIACQAMYQYTGPLFMALHRLPRGGEMYLPLVAVLEHVVLTFISRVKQQVGKICNGKTALNLLMQEASEVSSLSSIFERRKPFALLLQAYADGDLLDSVNSPESLPQQSGLMPLAPSPSDTAGSLHSRPSSEDELKAMDEYGEGQDSDEAVLDFELSFLKPYLDFSVENKRITVCTDEELMRAACLAHGLLKLAGLLEGRLKTRTSTGKTRLLTSTRALREAIKTIKSNGVKMAKFCRLDMLMQALIRISKVCRSSTLVAQDAVRIPSCVNELGDYITSASDNLREAAGNAVTAYTFSSLEQYIPFFLMQSVRVVAKGMGIVTKAPLTMNGIETLDRSGSVLYRDLKGATSFENSFWDVELAAASFELSAGFMAMLEFDMEELVAYYTANHEDFSEADFQLMFAMNGPRRRGDIGRFHMTKRQLQQVQP